MIASLQVQDGWKLLQDGWSDEDVERLTGLSLPGILKMRAEAAAGPLWRLGPTVLATTLADQPAERYRCGCGCVLHSGSTSQRLIADRAGFSRKSLDCKLD